VGLLAQTVDGREGVISHFLRVLTASQAKYSTLKTEPLAIVFALERFNYYYLAKTQVRIVDCIRALQSLFSLDSQDNIEGTSLQWRLRASQFKIENVQSDSFTTDPLAGGDASAISQPKMSAEMAVLVDGFKRRQVSLSGVVV